MRGWGTHAFIVMFLLIQVVLPVPPALFVLPLNLYLPARHVFLHAG